MNSAHFDFSGQRMLVTGATSGIGWEVTRQLLASGADVYAMGRDPVALETLAGLGCTALRVDMADHSRLSIVLADLPVMHALVNCAGISILEAASEVSAQAFDQVMAVNVRAAAMVAASVATAMIGEGVAGCIVNVSSQASLVALDDHLAYCASKGAMDAMTRVQCGEWGKHGIRVNSVNPTVTLTPMAQMAWSEPSKRDPALAAIPLGRFAQTSEVAAPILFLLSNAASMISGVSLPVDGGYTSR